MSSEITNPKEKIQEYMDGHYDVYGFAGATALDRRMGTELMSRAETEARNFVDEFTEGTIDAEKLALKLHAHFVAEGELHEGIKFDSDEEAFQNFLEAANSHACSMAGEIVEKILDPVDADRNFEDTVWSYLTKNYYFRRIVDTLYQNSRTSMVFEWFLHVPKEDGVVGEWDEKLTRPGRFGEPEVRKSSLLTPLEKPECYFPSQMLRVLQAAKRGREYTGLIHEDDRHRFDIPFQVYEEVILKSKSIPDLAAGVAVKTVEQLFSRGATQEQIIQLVYNGYKPTGPIKEHGLVDEVRLIWQKIEEKIELIIDSTEDSAQKKRWEGLSSWLVELAQKEIERCEQGTQPKS